jgi:TRAP-type C4-dicarboxylate transport system substrate-binding protein
MDEDQRHKATERFKRFKNLPPEKQAVLREKFKKFMQMSPEERARLRRKRAWFQSLPEERRSELREQWKSMDKEQRHEFIQRRRQSLSAPRDDQFRRRGSPGP